MQLFRYISAIVFSFLLLNTSSLCSAQSLAPVYLLLLDGPRWYAPSNLAATPLSSRSVRLTWQDNSDDEDAFLVEMEVEGVFYPLYDDVDANSLTVDLWPGVGKTFSPSTTYNFRIKAYKGTAYYNATQETGYSNIATVTTPPAPAEPPSTPTNLSASPISTSEIFLSWAHTSADEDYFTIERNPDCSAGYEFAGNVVAGTHVFTDTGLDADQTFCYRVKAVNQIGASGWSNEVSTSTLPPSTVPLAPSNLMAAMCPRATCIQLTWADNSSTEEEFYLERSSFNNQSWTVLKTYPANTTSGYDSSLVQGNIYYYRIRAKNRFGYSDYSNEFSIYSTKGITAPLPPQTAPSAAALSSNSIRVTWQDSSSNEDNFLIARSLTGEQFTFSFVGTVGQDVTTFDDGGLTPSTTYYYMIYACNIAGCRENGLTGSATTLSESSETVPAAPSSLTVTPVDKSSTSLSLVWQDNSANETMFEIRWGTDSNPAHAQLYGYVFANDNTAVITGLNPCSTYYYWVYATNSIGTSSESASGSGTTAPAAPAGLIASTGTAIHFIFLDWNTVACAAKYHVYRIDDWDVGPQLIDPEGQSIINPLADDPNVIPNYTPFYRVSAEDGAGNEGSLSCTVSPQAAHGGATGPGDTCLAAVGWAASPAPLHLTASWENYTDKIIVSWSAVQLYWDVPDYSTASWAPSYRLLFDDGSGWKPVANGNDGYIFASELSASPLKFTHYNLPSNWIFNYALQTVYDCGTVFPDSCTFSDWVVTDAKTAAATPVSVLRAPAITASEYGLNLIYVGWSYTEGADSYKLYRASSSGGTYNPIGTFSGSTTVYNDITNAYVEYWYKVRAVKNGVDGPLSDSAHGSSTSF